MTQTEIKMSPVKEPLIERGRLAEAYFKARSRLLAEQRPGAYWEGELASSSLSTATAICALILVDRKRFTSLIAGGIRWLLDHQNSDGGWGDTVKSFSNISTTMLCRAALTLGREGLAGDDTALTDVTPSSERIDESLSRAERYLESIAGGREPQTLARAVRERYGKDRTFSVPILSCSALAGLTDWSEVPALPFELASFPASAYKWLNLPVVSYALPALIALGIVRYTRQKPRNPIIRLIRQAVIPRVLGKLASIQPVNGGFLEATPLVSFVTMSLAGAGLTAHIVARRGARFLASSVRPDGSWPIDTNLSTWVTTLSINALSEGLIKTRVCGDDFNRDGMKNGRTGSQPVLPAMVGQVENLSYRFSEEFGESAGRLRRWLLDQQYRSVHPFTSAAPGGWGWTPLPGAVPDADDTAGALIALRHLGLSAGSCEAARAGLKWLLDLQNVDGGWPTFCRGWGSLPFDRSSADITAHAIRALHLWSTELYHFSFGAIWMREALSQRLKDAIDRGLRFLQRKQRPDGSWAPLWFGNQYAPDDENLTYGTARVLVAYCDLNLQESPAAQRGYLWLLASQGKEGGWGGAAGTPPSIEETALAVDALLGCNGVTGSNEALVRGLRWLIERVEDGSFLNASPIGFYFARLWYFERLYPLIFTVSALGRALATGDTSAWVQTTNSAGELYA